MTSKAVEAGQLYEDKDKRPKRAGRRVRVVEVQGSGAEAEVVVGEDLLLEEDQGATRQRRMTVANLVRRYRLVEEAQASS